MRYARARIADQMIDGNRPFYAYFRLNNDHWKLCPKREAEGHTLTEFYLDEVPDDGEINENLESY